MLQFFKRLWILWRFISSWQLGNLQVFGNTLSKVLNGRAFDNDIELPYVEVSKYILAYKTGQFFCTDYEGLGWRLNVRLQVVWSWKRWFQCSGWKMDNFCRTKSCVFHESFASASFYIASYSRIGGHFRFTKIMSGLNYYHCRYKARGIRTMVIVFWSTRSTKIQKVENILILTHWNWVDEDGDHLQRTTSWPFFIAMMDVTLSQHWLTGNLGECISSHPSKV